MGKNWKRRENRGEHRENQQAAGNQYEKIPGTQIKMLSGGIPVRVVRASGKEFTPNDVKGAWSHLEKLERTGQGGQGQNNGQRKGKGKGVIKTHVKQVKGKGKTQGQAKGQGKNGKQQKGGGKGQKGHSQAPQKTGKGGGKSKGGKAVQAAPVKVKKGGFAATMVKKKNLKNGKGAGKGGKGRKGKRKERARTPEQEAAFKEKLAERHATKIEKEMRMLVSDTYYTGEVVSAGRKFCWVLPQSPPLPASVMSELKKMNDEFREKAANPPDGKKARPFANGCEGNVVYVATADIEEETLQPEEGTAVKFKLYTDSKGVGGCEVVSA